MTVTIVRMFCNVFYAANWQMRKETRNITYTRMIARLRSNVNRLLANMGVVYAAMLNAATRMKMCCRIALIVIAVDLRRCFERWK
jgi:hypothetical protein